MFAAISLAGAIGSAWTSKAWGPSWVAAAILLALTSTLTLLFALRPAIEVHDGHLRVGKRIVFWSEVQALDRISVWNTEPWVAPLLLRLTLAHGQELLILHPGDVDGCISLLRHIYRYSRAALLDGVPYHQFWGEQPPVAAPLSLPRPRLLLPEDEEEVERLFQRLKVAGRLDGSDES